MAANTIQTTVATVTAAAMMAWTRRRVSVAACVNGIAASTPMLRTWTKNHHPPRVNQFPRGGAAGALTPCPAARA